ncbi:putative signal transducing protein [Parvularcula sp. IMCC14364]|uniref:putative signal transducing protein n=1 Tax=Parvularcula sp. IMCC14364 TaxID=3067902 RepID=UPI002740F9A9|nr:DUF2007 domain-containing protein [Parvularcula sp. IMCC14364]
MKTVATFLNPEEAKVARSFLVANEIEAIIAGEESLSVMPHIGMGTKSYQLMVDDEDENQALRLLAVVEETHAALRAERKESGGFDTKRLFLGLAILASIFLIFIGNSYSSELAPEGASAADYISCWLRNVF